MKNWLLFLVVIVFGAVMTLITMQESRDEKEWRDFVVSHHCTVKTPGAFSRVAIWACDGFEVEHQ